MLLNVKLIILNQQLMQHLILLTQKLEQYVLELQMQWPIILVRLEAVDGC